MIDPFQAALRHLASPEFAGKLYTGLEAQYSCKNPGMRAFDKVNLGLLFQRFQMMDMTSSPVLVVFFADASFAQTHMSHHPIYSKFIAIIH